MRPILDLSSLNKEVRKIQNGDSRKYNKFLANRKMGDVHRFQVCLLPYSSKPTVQEIPTFSMSVHCFNEIQNCSQGREVDGS